MVASALVDGGRTFLLVLGSMIRLRVRYSSGAGFRVGVFFFSWWGRYSPGIADCVPDSNTFGYCSNEGALYKRSSGGKEIGSRQVAEGGL